MPKADYIDSIWFDIEGAKEEILENPMYMILNLCRVAAYLKEGLITSKKQGGEWGLRKLPEKYHSLIGEALAGYTSEKQMVAKKAIMQEFAEYMLELIREQMIGLF